MANYPIYDENYVVKNVISYDGKSEYNPGAGLKVHTEPSETAAIGDVYDPKTFTFTKPVIEEIVAVPSIEEQLATLQAQIDELKR